MKVWVINQPESVNSSGGWRGDKGSSTVLFAGWGRVNTTVNERMKQITRVRSNVSQHITLPLNKYCLLLLLLWANPPPSPQSPDRAFGRPQSASSMYTKPPRSHDPLYTCSIVEVIVGGNVCSTPLSQRLSGQAKVKEEGLFYFHVATAQWILPEQFPCFSHSACLDYPVITQHSCSQLSW